jgi:hypothetical protein
MSKTFVYLCRDGENEELRYSIRSAYHFYPDSSIWVVGGKPDWYIGNFIEVPKTNNKFETQRNNLASITYNEDIPDEVIVMNDDFFFVKHLEEIPNYVSGTLRNKILFYRSNGIRSSYVRRLVESYRHCKKFANPPLDFDIHVPMPINKKNLSMVVDEEIMWRSNYGNRFIYKEVVEVIEDVKVYNDEKHKFKSYDFLSWRYPVVSSDEKSFPILLDQLLLKMFPDPSPYEMIEED